jgi:quercetin dioxygenase-like cupin family protein
MFEQPREERIVVGQLEMRFFVDGSHTSGHMSMAEMIVPPGAKVPPPHSHGDVDETAYVIQGRFNYRIGDELHELRAGDRRFSPRGLVHAFSNPGDEPVRVLLTFSPAKIGPAYFREVGDLLAAGGPPDFAKVRAVMEKHGLVLAV